MRGAHLEALAASRGGRLRQSLDEGLEHGVLEVQGTLYDRHKGRKEWRMSQEGHDEREG